MKNFLAFDLGASSGRGIIGKLENGKLTLTEVHRFANGPTEQGGSIYWNYPQLVEELKTGLKKALAIEPALDGIGIDTWGVDYVFFSNTTGRFLRWPYHYRDVRTGNAESDVWSKISKQELYGHTGIQCMTLNTVYQLAAHFREHPEDFKDSHFLTMPDALARALGGDDTSEYTDCSTTNLLDPVTKEWDWEVIDRVGLPREVFPKIVKPCTFGGTLSEELQRELGCGPIPIIKVGSHDTASAVGAVPAPTSGNWAYISAGTWALLGAGKGELHQRGRPRRQDPLPDQHHGQLALSGDPAQLARTEGPGAVVRRDGAHGARLGAVPLFDQPERREFRDARRHAAAHLRLLRGSRRRSDRRRRRGGACDLRFAGALLPLQARNARFAA